MIELILAGILFGGIATGARFLAGLGLFFMKFPFLL